LLTTNIHSIVIPTQNVRIQAAPPIAGGRGFSLLELLVVVAIVVILFALLVQGFGDYKTNLIRLQCQENLRSYAGAFVHFETDHGGWLPPGPLTQSAEQSNLDSVGWRNPLSDYMNGPHLRCAIDGHRPEGSRGTPQYGMQREFARHVRNRQVGQALSDSVGREMFLLLCHRANSIYSPTHITNSLYSFNIFHGHGPNNRVQINFLMPDFSVVTLEQGIGRYNNMMWRSNNWHNVIRGTPYEAR